ncbi:3e06407e-e9b3-4e68-aee4-9fa6e1654700 [Sclerotinia trifoliorum]|uniref:3e06407e-e9b3-4e68-aee4-9fa6e1654700 n=1 Tax=Sclerotinia trifoliorum TaxID=28548 RepID=A0A8H2VVQ2_9HELO|nr:3e06407e-e9b3-4e68-aee4-9fa6e1654700 [Sclerotinia trifoliorum]
METMENEHEEQRKEEPQRIWGAKDSLRRHTKGRKSIILSVSEEAPLLGNDGARERESREGNQEALWEGHGDFAGLTWWHKPSVYWLLLPFFLLALAVGGIIVPKLNLILALVCRSYLAERSSQDPNFLFTPVLLGSDNPQCRIPEVQSLVTKFTLAITIITGIISAIMSPLLGAWSDRNGRKKILAISSLGGFLTEIITILAGKYPDTVSYQWLLAGAVFDGLCGSFTAGMALTHAYAADCTAPSKRAVAFAYFHACLFAGVAIGPLLAAAVFHLTQSLVTVFYVALGIHTFFILFLLLVVPESLTRKRQEVAREKHAAGGLLVANQTWLGMLKTKNPLAPLKVLWPTGGGNTKHVRANLVLLATVDTIIFGVAMGVMTVMVYYSGYQFGWRTSETSLYMSVVNSTRVFTLIAILPIFNYLVRTRPRNRLRRESGFAIPESQSGADSIDLFVVRLSIIFEVVGYLGFTLARSGPLFVASGIMASMGGVGSPTLQSALTKHVPHDQIGQLLGATGLLHALARVVCPTIFNLIYAQTVGTYPQTVFLVLTACFVFAFTFSWFIRPNVSLETPFQKVPSSQEANSNQDVIVDEQITGV